MCPEGQNCCYLNQKWVILPSLSIFLFFPALCLISEFSKCFYQQLCSSTGDWSSPCFLFIPEGNNAFAERIHHSEDRHPLTFSNLFSPLWFCFRLTLVEPIVKYVSVINPEDGHVCLRVVWSRYFFLQRVLNIAHTRAEWAEHESFWDSLNCWLQLGKNGREQLLNSQSRTKNTPTHSDFHF